MIKDVLKLAFVLCIISALATACVSFAYDLTKPIISGRQELAISQSYTQVFPSAGNLNDKVISGPNLVAVKESVKDGSVNGYIYTVNPEGYGGSITMMVGISYPEAIVTGVKILAQNETPGLGAKCTNPAFTEQFFAKNLNKKLTVRKNGNPEPHEIQAITGSTITSQAVVNGVNAAREHYYNIYAERIQKED